MDSIFPIAIVREMAYYLRVMKVKEKKPPEGQVPFDPILFAVTVPPRQPTAKDLADARERADDAVEPKDHDTMDSMVKDL